MNGRFDNLLSLARTAWFLLVLLIIGAGMMGLMDLWHFSSLGAGFPFIDPRGGAAPPPFPFF